MQQTKWMRASVRISLDGWGRGMQLHNGPISCHYLPQPIPSVH